MFDSVDDSVSFSLCSRKELDKAFRYYNYIREFYGYLLDSIGWSLEPEDASFNPATAPAEKVFAPIENKLDAAIAAYERMIEIVTAWSVEKYEQEKEKREWGLQDPEKFALTSIAEMLLMPAIWYEFDVRSQKELAKFGDDAQSDVMLMDALSLEDHIFKLFVKQKGCLDEFLPRKLEELKKLQAEAGT